MSSALGSGDHGKDLEGAEAWRDPPGGLHRWSHDLPGGQAPGGEQGTMDGGPPVSADQGKQFAAGHEAAAGIWGAASGLVEDALGAGRVEDRDDQPSAGPGDACHFGQDPGRIGGELQGGHGDGGVHARVGQGEPICVGADDPASGCREREHRGVGVEADRLSAVAGEDAQEPAGAAADIGHPPASEGA
jgi:hypothetical protein